MKIIRLISVLGIIAMTLALMNGFINGDFFVDGSKLLANPWGVVSFVDLYVGFVLFSVWIAIREDNAIQAFIWIVLMMILGFFTGSIYMLYASIEAKEDVIVFLLGKKRADKIKDSLG
jgi:hypothetical protein